jgi:crotonobetainyl-CoA:carnitine CoA-transferase CaiB-like acyl-CoA transferase
VLELSRGVSAAYCGRQFAIWGADVVVLEPEGGHPIRRLHPFAKGSDLSLVWANVAANKRSMTLAGEALSDLFARADVLVTDYNDGGLAAFGLSLAAIHKANPALSVVSITPFGLNGPYADFTGSELIIQALSGYLGLNGLMGEPPLRAPGRIVDYAVGVNAFVGALASHYKRERTGCAELVEVSGLESLAAIIPFLRVQYMGGDKVREGGTEAGVRILPCADGWLSFMPVAQAQQKTFGEVFDIPDDAWPADLYEGDYLERVRKAVGFLSEYTRRKSADELFHALEARGVTCGKVVAPGALLDLDQLDARGFFRAGSDPDLGPVRFVGPAARQKRSDMIEPRPAPRAGDRVADTGWDVRPVAQDRSGAAELPLRGVRVLDLTQAWIGPYATLIFADLGADVIKIESHRRPDVWRQASPQPVAITNVTAEKVNRSHYFNSVNRNKRNLTLDLRSAEGKDLFLRLVKDADVVAENYTAHVMRRFGLDYPVLSQHQPGLVMMSSSGFGKSGPWMDYKTNGSAIEALGGWDALHHYPGGQPVLMGFYQADAICGLQMASLTLLGLIRRQRTGEGEAIDGAMLEASASYLGDLILQAQVGEPLEAVGNRSPDMAPHGVFPCRGEDRWIAIAAPDEAAWRALLTMPGLPADLADDRFSTLEGRFEHQDLLDALLAEWTATWEPDALMSALQAACVPAGVVRSAREGLDEPQLAARDWFKTMTHPDLGAHKYNGFPWSFADCELKATIPPPRLGEHSDLLLKELLHLTPAQIADLKAKDITGTVF